MSASEKSANKLCVFCGKLITGHGNNAEPLASGKCCDECNMKVIMTRSSKHGKKKSPHRGGKTRKKSYKKIRKQKNTVENIKIRKNLEKKDDNSIIYKL